MLLQQALNVKEKGLHVVWGGLKGLLLIDSHPELTKMVTNQPSVNNLPCKLIFFT